MSHEAARFRNALAVTTMTVAAATTLVACRGLIGIESLHESDGGLSSPDGSPSPSGEGGGEGGAGIDAGCTLPADPMRGVPGCPVVKNDTTADPNPLSFWGEITCESLTRHQYVAAGGDPHVDGTGAPQGNDAFRRLTSLDDDTTDSERCDLGENRLSGPTVLYREGNHRITFVSARIAANTFAQSQLWQTVFQLTPTYPGQSAKGSPVEITSFGGKWHLNLFGDPAWSVPARADVWTRFAVDVVFSQDKTKGRVQVFVDLDGDGDADGQDERSPVLTVATLATQQDDVAGIDAGDAIPSHLRAGINRDPAMSCPGPDGCRTDIDNVQVIDMAP